MGGIIRQAQVPVKLPWPRLAPSHCPNLDSLKLWFDRLTGQTEFQFKAGGLNFHSSSYDWLVVAGANAKYKGVGTINGSGNYGFMLTATDEKLTPSTDVDLFRIKIWDKDAGDGVVYDNKMGAGDDSYDGTSISGGNIVVHKAK